MPWHATSINFNYVWHEEKIAHTHAYTHDDDNKLYVYVYNKKQESMCGW